MNLSTLKKLCRSNRMQIIYNRAKELSGIHLFDNDRDLSKIQVFFLYYLELYGILFSDLNTNEKYISEEVIEDDVRTEAYLLYRKQKKSQNTEINDKEKHVDSNYGNGSIIFKKAKK